MADEDSEVILRKHSIASLLQEREQFLVQIKILKTQLLEAGITPFQPLSKSTPDLSQLKRVSLPMSSTKVSESTTDLKASFCTDNEKRQSLTTYDKRSGTNDLGKQYEYVMCAFYAIRFATSAHVGDFEMTTNDEIYGDFDDIAIKVRYVDDSTHTYLLQLKHTENKRGLTEKILAAENKDFSLMKYHKTFQNLEEKDNVSCILFTNRTAHFKELSQFAFKNVQVVVKKFEEVNCECLLDTNQTPRKSVFQFGTTTSNDLQEFLQHFYLFANQNNVSKMKTLIIHYLKELLQCDVYDTFIHFMKNWWCGNFVLTKNDVLAKLAELALSPSIRNISNEKTTQKTRLLEEAILKFDLTIVQGVETEVIGQIWTRTDELREVSLTALKYGLTNKGISCLEELTLEQKTKALWYLDKVPLVVKANESRKAQVKCVVDLLEKMGVNKKLLILGDFSKEDFPGWKVFENLADLAGDALYGRIVKEFEVSLQGRDSISLQTLIGKPEKMTIIKVRELFLMSQETMVVGEKKSELPESYISRTVSTNFLDTEKVLLRSMHSQDLLIFNCNTNFPNFLKNKNISFMELGDYAGESEVSVLLAFKFTKSQFDEVRRKSPKHRVHLLQVIDEASSFLVLSSDNIFKSEDLKYHKPPISENEIHKVFDSPINVLCAQPGIGKSTMIKYLDNNCPRDYWSVCVNLRKFNSLLKEEPEEEEILMNFLELEGVTQWSLLDEIKSLFFENRKIYLFLDGLDEIESNCVDFALDYVNYVASTGVRVWISSRQNLQEVITTRLNVFPIDIQELNHEEQTKYIKQRLEARYETEEVQQISEEIFHSADVTNTHNMLGIPLQLYIITENFLDDVELYHKLTQQIFVLTKMYQIFFEGKKKHLYEKVGVQYEQQLGFNFNLYLESYEIPALRCCLDDATFQRLNVDTSKSEEFLEMIKMEGDKFGIISQINEDRAVFIHQTYAEYFACLWLKKNFTKARILKDEFKFDKYQNLRLIFDIMLAENCPLHLAVIYQHSDQVKKHLSNIASRDEGGRSALHLICSYGSRYLPLPLVPSLYSNQLYHDENQFSGESTMYREIFTSLKQCDPFEVDEVFKWNSLDYCFHFQCLYPTEMFLEQYEDKVKVDLLLGRLNSVTLVYYASKLGYPNIVKAVVKRNRNVVHFKIGEEKLSFLHVAVKSVTEDADARPVKGSTQIKVIQILIENGIDINVKDHNGATALHWAVAQGRYDLAKALLDEGADVNATTTKDETVIHHALRDWDNQVKTFNIDSCSGFDTTATDQDGATILHWACREGDYDLGKRIIEKEVDVNATNKIGETALHYAVQAWKPNLDIVRLLIDSGVDVNCNDSNGVSPLHWAFDKGHYDVIGVLHQKGAIVTTITVEHKVPLRNGYKPQKPNMAVIEMLMDYGFNVNAKGLDEASILHWVAEKGHLGVVRLLIANGANINATSKNNETILHYAAKGWNPKLVEMFTEIGIDVNSGDINGITALHRAAQSGHIEMIKSLVDHGSTISSTTTHGDNVLTFAVNTPQPHPDLITYLLQSGIDVNNSDQDGISTLHCACERGHYSIVKLLLDHGAKVNSVSKNGKTPLHYTSPNTDLIELLLQSGVNVNATDVEGMTALHWASERGQFDLVKTLLQFGSDVNSANNEGETILIYAVKQRKINLDVVRLLVKQGADVKAVDKKGLNALHRGCEMGYYEVVKLLLKKGVDVNSLTKKNETALHYASMSWQPNTQVIKRLAASGANINFLDDDGTTALHWACKEGQFMNVELLVALGGDVNAVTNNQETTLHFAAKAWKFNVNVFELLISGGVDVNAVDAEGKTALHWAAEKGFYDNVRFLLDRGASVDAVTRTNLTALHFAVYGGQVRIIKLLIDKGLNVDKVDTKNMNLPLYFAVRNGHLKEDLLVMMAATIHEKFPLLSWRRYSYQEVITYLQEAQPYLEPQLITRNASTSMESRGGLLRTCQDVVADNVSSSVAWLKNIFNMMICKKFQASCYPSTPTFIVHYPVFPSGKLGEEEEVKTPTIDRAYTF